jgi:superfamily I DNA/RNA helicase
MLESIYSQSGDQEVIKIFRKQMKEKKVDRIDLTLLLLIQLENEGRLSRRDERAVRNREGEWKRRTTSKPLSYSLMLVDEFQNYMPEQLSIFKQCFAENDQAMLYVGDIAQQIRFGTLRDWQDIGEKIDEPRKILLDKVYRNTKSILSYIQSIGYNVEIPAELDQGLPVEEKIISNVEEEKEWVRQKISEMNEGSVGILSKSLAYIENFKNIKKEGIDVHCMAIREAQGLEFDTVFLVGIGSEESDDVERNILSGEIPNAFSEEKKRIEKDLLYVALTRAIKRLFVSGKKKISDVCNF